MNTDFNESETIFSQSSIDGSNESVIIPQTQHPNDSTNDSQLIEENVVTENATIQAISSSNDATILVDLCTQIESEFMRNAYFLHFVSMKMFIKQILI